MAHICKHNKQFLKHNTIFLKHKSILWNTTQNYRNTTQNYRNTTQNYRNTTQNYRNTTQNCRNTTQNYRNTIQNYRNTTQSCRNTTQNYRNNTKYWRTTRVSLGTRAWRRGGCPIWRWRWLWFAEMFLMFVSNESHIPEASLTVRKPVEMEKPDLLFWQRFKRDQSRMKTQLVRRRFFRHVFRTNICSILPSKSKSFPFLSCWILTMIYTKSIKSLSVLFSLRFLISEYRDVQQLT